VCVRHAGTPCPVLVPPPPARYLLPMPTTAHMLETSYPQAESRPQTASTTTARADYDGCWASSGTLGFIVVDDRLAANPINRVDPAGCLSLVNASWVTGHKPTMDPWIWTYAVNFTLDSPINGTVVQENYTQIMVSSTSGAHSGKAFEAETYDVFAISGNAFSDTVDTNARINTTVAGFLAAVGPACHAFIVQFSHVYIYNTNAVTVALKDKPGKWVPYDPAAHGSGQLFTWARVSDIDDKHPAGELNASPPVYRRDESAKADVAAVAGDGHPLLTWQHWEDSSWNYVGGAWHLSSSHLRYSSKDSQTDLVLSTLKV
jgi:hypothetical protein